MINFRNIENNTFKFYNDINYIYGQNGSGKTNIMEAIYYLSCAKSFRGVRDSDIIMKTKEHFFLEGKVVSKNKTSKIEIGNNTKNKNIYINKKQIRKNADLFGIFYPVIFSPQDIFIVQGAPSVRRKCIDRLIASLEGNYIKILKDYNYAIEERNKLLRDMPDSEEDVYAAFEEVLVKNGLKISEFRMKYIDIINSFISPIYKHLTDNFDALNVFYKSSFDMESQVNLKSKYKDSRNRDIILKRTTLGPHLDDVEIFLNNEKAKYFASTGEQKTIGIAIRLAEARVYGSINNEVPVLLLDDIFSELDESRREHLINSFFNKGQIIITSPDKCQVKGDVNYIKMENLDA